MAHQPLKANFFPGILEGLVGRLGLAPPGITDPPTSVREGVAHHWAATLKETIRRTVGRDVNLRQVTSTVVPHGLHLDYDLDFQTRRVDDVAGSQLALVESAGNWPSVHTVELSMRTLRLPSAM